jgi:hypothetical protein
MKELPTRPTANRPTELLCDKVTIIPPLFNGLGMTVPPQNSGTQGARNERGLRQIRSRSKDDRDDHKKRGHLINVIFRISSIEPDEDPAGTNESREK